MSAKPLLIINDIAGRLNLSPVTIAHWAYRRKPAPKDFPEPIKIGGRLRWRPEAIDAWLDALQEVPRCWRWLKTDHLCWFKTDQGWRPRGTPLGCG